VNTFELVRPRHVDEALAALDADDPSVRPVGGGTALMLMMKQKLFQPTRLVWLQSLENDLRGIRVDEQGGLRVGALTPLCDLEKSPEVARIAPVLSQALKTLASVRIRNAATIGGHIAHADPHMDLPPILLGSGARVQAMSSRGSRWIELAELFRGYYETSLQRDELLTELAIPALPDDVRGAYQKCTSISADDWPTLGVAVFFAVEEGRLGQVRVVVSAATEKPVRLAAVEQLLTGERPTELLLQAAGDMASTQIQPLPDIRGTIAYKREMARVYVRRALEVALQAQQKGV
jgi:aerobic carbon-monoxide dehydrogenase medium subunit